MCLENSMFRALMHVFLETAEKSLRENIYNLLEENILGQKPFAVYEL